MMLANRVDSSGARAILTLLFAESNLVSDLKFLKSSAYYAVSVEIDLPPIRALDSHDPFQA